ncbi:MAG: NAD(P)H-dependent oxidoreductase [Anaerovoracaceae bacterium]|jgi:NAD(P)H dehydrogenase (quinone)
MHTTIVYTHPYNGSYNRAILDNASDALNEAGKDLFVIDLYRDGFEPAMTKRELEYFSHGEPIDSMVSQYQVILKNTDEIIFIFPIWWHNAPAMLRGFLDKVMLKGAAYNEEGNEMIPIWDIRKTTVVTTSEATTETLVNDCGNPIGGTFINATLKGLGMTGGVWLNLGHIKETTDTERAEFLEKVRKTVVR